MQFVIVQHGLQEIIFSFSELKTISCLKVYQVKGENIYERFEIICSN